MELPIDYTTLNQRERKIVREAYVILQDGKCYYCSMPLTEAPLKQITNKEIKWHLFPGGKNFLNHPVHLQHNHDTGMTEGAVHAYCNAVLWQYEGK